MFFGKVALMLAMLTAPVVSAVPIPLPVSPSGSLSVSQPGSQPVTVSPLVLDIPEMDDPDLPDTAMAEMTAGGPVIFYNPALFLAAGPAREFVRAHEQAHVLLAHLEDARLVNTDAGRREAEAEADCFAAHHASALSVRAMTRLLLRRPPEPRDSIYGTKPERARRILGCAGLTSG